MFSKYLVVVDDDATLQHEANALPSFRDTEPKRDSTSLKNPTDALDHAQTIACWLPTWSFDATANFPGEGYPREWRNCSRWTSSIKARWTSCGAELLRRVDF